MNEQGLKKTPLYNEHLSLNARIIPFGGWMMPVQYEGILAEYEHTRRHVSVFDTSHMGEFAVQGDCVETRLDSIVTMRLRDLPVKSCRYGFMLNEHGGVLDDLIVFRVERDRWFIVVNGATIEKDSRNFVENISPAASFQNISERTGKIDIQGPDSRAVLKKIVTGVEKLDYYTFDYFEILGKNILISRTGYTGELGFELYPPAESTAEIWKLLMEDVRVKPAGLGARDILRLEAGYSLYGHELNEDINPLQAGLMKFVDLEKDFIGREALLKQKEKGVEIKVSGFLSQNRRAPRAGQKLFNKDKEQIGIVTSGTFSPFLNKGIGLGLVNTGDFSAGSELFFGDEKGAGAANFSKRIFYTQGSLKE